MRAQGAERLSHGPLARPVGPPGASVCQFEGKGERCDGKAPKSIDFKDYGKPRHNSTASSGVFLAFAEVARVLGRQEKDPLRSTCFSAAASTLDPFRVLSASRRGGPVPFRKRASFRKRLR